MTYYMKIYYDHKIQFKCNLIYFQFGGKKKQQQQNSVFPAIKKLISHTIKLNHSNVNVQCN